MIVGKFRSILLEKCPKCKEHLHVRVIFVNSVIRGAVVTSESGVIVCPGSHCDYIRKAEANKRDFKAGRDMSDGFGQQGIRTGASKENARFGKKNSGRRG